MIKTVLSLLIATSGGCWTGGPATQSTTPSPAPAGEPADRAAAPPEPAALPVPAAPVETAAAVPASPVETAAATTVAAPVETAAATPAAPVETAAATTVAVAPDAAVARSWYLTAGALYLPIDEGYSAANAGLGWRLRSGASEGRLGARISYGSSPYASVFAVLVGGMQLHWWGSFGMGIGADLGVVAASQNMGGGWDGTTFGGTLTATFRHRFARTELSFDLGLLYAAGEDDPTAPFALISVMLPL